MPIGNAFENGNFVSIRDEKNNVLASVPKCDGLLGYTSTTVTVKNGTFIKTYDAAGRVISNTPAPKTPEE
jgi:hypothetical protein